MLGLTNKFFTAFWAGDGDLALSPGNTHRLSAPGAVEISVVFVLDFLQKLEIFPVFLVPLVGIPGKTAEKCPEHQPIGGKQKQDFKSGIS